MSDTVILATGKGARQGKYVLQVGLYNVSDGMRLPVRDQDDKSVSGDQIV